MPETRYVEVDWRAHGTTEVEVAEDQEPEDVFWMMVDGGEIDLADYVTIDYVNDPEPR